MKAARKISPASPFHDHEPESRVVINRESKPVVMSGAEQVVLWLNAARTKSPQAYERIKVIHGIITELAQAFTELDNGITQSGFDALQQRHTELNARLARYSLCPQVSYFMAAAVWKAPLIARDSDDDFELPYGDPAYRLKLVEASVAHTLVKLTETNSAHHVRQCDQCKEKWIVATRGVDRFCGKKCRESFFQASPEYRPNRLSNLARYRAVLKRLPYFQALSR